MKTTRTNCFETNSSSTHSFTILSKAEEAKKKNNVKCGTLLENGVLCPNNITETNAYRVLDYGDGGFSVRAESTIEKAALSILHIAESIRYESKKHQLNEVLAFTSELIVHLIDEVKSVSFTPDTYGRFGGYSEYGDPSLASKIANACDEEDEPLDTIKSIIKEHFDSVVLNDDAIMLEEENPY